MKFLLVLLLSVLTARAADFDAVWSEAAQGSERSTQTTTLLEMASAPDLSSTDRLQRLWQIYLIAQTADQHRQILRQAAQINDVRARMLVGVYRFNEEFSKELAKDQAAANKAQLKLLHGGQETLNYKDLPDNSYDTSFAFDRWENKDGVTGRWTADGVTLDISPRPFGTFHALLKRPGREPVTMVGSTRDGGAIFLAPGASAWFLDGAGGLVEGDKRTELHRPRCAEKLPNVKPGDAITLFDGKNTDAFQPTKWKTVEIHPQFPELNALEITRGSGALTTKESFGDMRLYLEFRQAYNPDTVGGRRGNSGVVLMSFYEIALSDNFAEPPQTKANGAIYGVAAPLVNASAAPLEWQSLLIDFTAPRFDAEGKKIAHARVTAWQNGHLIHDNVEIATPWDKKPEPQKPAPLQLQQHGSCLQFRNIWAVKK